MSSIATPAGTTIKTVILATSTTVRAADRSPRSARAIARSAFPAAKVFVASRALPVSMTLRRTGALIDASRLAIVDMIVAASPSIDPAATVKVRGCVR